MLKLLMKHFPEYQERIARLYQADTDFRGLCADYEEVAQTLAFWLQLSKLPAKQIERHITDGKELLQELETEIRMALQEHSPPEATGLM